ncbi:MAG: serine/threonine protein kinase [Acidobacteriaceae bacterium]|nr:serine/threonine protein kinase [Acidobacteriaceae bacterium]
MTLTSGSKLGPYEVVSAIGAGGMGEVYRAHDARLGRDVALKVLPDNFSSDTERLARFEQEARAIATLNHPNIVAVFDIGEHGGTRYIVTELLEGETLRTKLADGALPVRKVQDFALQIAQGLAAAHDKGIVHRDLKPENIIISKDGRAKILDFGLAKQNPMTMVAAGATMTAVPQTTPGVMLGTIGYMSPEQVRGMAADHRSDIFSFGAVLHEMLSGERPFRRDTSAEIMTAILKEDPPELESSATRAIPPGIERIMRRCLEKDPEQRFQSARDLAFALEAMSGASTSASQVGIAGKAYRFSVSLPVVVICAVALLLVAGGSFALMRGTNSTPPLFRQLTASRGYMRMARFSPDGQTVVFGGMWNGEPMRLWLQRTDASVFNPLAVPDADLFSVSSTGELAIALNRHFPLQHIGFGTLARTSFTGGAPREVLDNVVDADWSADGSALAVARKVGNRFRLEYPIGKVLYETSGYVSNLRFSHSGDKIAFMDHPVYGDDRGFISVVDLAGKRTVLTRDYPSEDGLAWSPDDSELWFSSNDEDSGVLYSLHAVTLAKKDRVILRSPVNVRVQDIAKDGRVLLIAEAFRIDTTLGDVTTGKTRDLTWVDLSWGQSLSNDAKWLAFSTQEPGATTNYSLFLRKTDGSPAVKLGEGGGDSISPDNQWVVSALAGSDQNLLLLPLGAGETRTLHSDNIHFETSTAPWMPDNKRFLMAAHEQGKGSRSYLVSMDSGEPKPVTPEDVVGDLLSPDGKELLAHDLQGRFFMFALEGGGSPRAITAIQQDETPIQWLKGGRTVIIREKGETTVNTYQLNVDTGAKKPWKAFTSRDKVGLQGIYNVQVTPDGAHYLLVENHIFSSLFVVKGLK